MNKPHIAWSDGWWRVKGHPLPWKQRSEKDKKLWDDAYKAISLLNQLPLYVEMRRAYLHAKLDRQSEGIDERD